MQSGPCIGTILQPRLHVAMALIPTPSFGFGQTCTVGPHGCWDCLGGVSVKPNEGFALGGPRNGRGGKKTAGAKIARARCVCKWSPYVGVHKATNCSKWEAQIKRGSKRHYLGTFSVRTVIYNYVTHNYSRRLVSHVMTRVGHLDASTVETSASCSSLSMR